VWTSRQVADHSFTVALRCLGGSAPKRSCRDDLPTGAWRSQNRGGPLHHGTYPATTLVSGGRVLACPIGPMDRLTKLRPPGGRREGSGARSLSEQLIAASPADERPDVRWHPSDRDTGLDTGLSDRRPHRLVEPCTRSGWGRSRGARSAKRLFPSGDLHSPANSVHPDPRER